MFYLTTHSTHFIYGYMVSDIWLRTILIVRKETRCRHIGHFYRLTARVLLYAPSHRQDNTYHGLCRGKFYHMHIHIGNTYTHVYTHKHICPFFVPFLGLDFFFFFFFFFFKESTIDETFWGKICFLSCPTGASINDIVMQGIDF